MNVEDIKSIVPDAQPIMVGEQEIGMTTSKDGSFDYTPEGMKYLGSLRFNSQGVKPQEEPKITASNISGTKTY